MPLTRKEKIAITEFISSWSVKPLFECGVLDPSDDEKWKEAEAYLKRCSKALRAFGRRKRKKEKS